MLMQRYPNPDFYERFDKVIVDAPCSALGIMYRKPDIKYAKTDIEGLYAVQRDILETCSRYVKKGGRLVYSTCSVNKCENSDIVTQFLSDNRMFREAELHSDICLKALRRAAVGGSCSFFLILTV